MILDTIYNFSKNVNPAIVFASIVSIVETTAQNNLKKDLLLRGIIFYSIVAYVLQFSYHKIPLSTLNTVWSSMSIIIANVLGHLLYKETFNKWKFLSVLTALISVFFSSFG